MNLYHDLILDHYRNPRNFGTLANPDIVVKETNASCGDEIEMFLTMSLRPAGIRLIHWRGQGCAISMAGASMLSDQVKNRKFKIRNILEITDHDMIEMLGGEISSARIKCATLALTALRKAIVAEGKE